MNIEPGPDTDRKVAQAIGFKRWIMTGDSNFEFGLYGPVLPEDVTVIEVDAHDDRLPQHAIPLYSTDLNAAFQAAEKVGLLHDHYLGHIGEWFVTQMPSNDKGVHTRSYTPALAICAAILKLKEKT